MSEIIDQRSTYHTKGNEHSWLTVSTFDDGLVILDFGTGPARASIHIDKDAAMKFALALIASVQTEVPKVKSAPVATETAAATA